MVRGIAKFIFFIIVAYWIVYLILLFSIPAPKVRVGLATECFLGEDQSLEISVWFWHQNFEVSPVRFYVDNASSTACVKGKNLYPLMLLEQEDLKVRSHWTIRNLIWPTTKTMTVQVPLQKLFQDGLVKAGVLKGNIDVSVIWISSWRHRRSFIGREYSSSQKMIQIPFELTLREKFEKEVNIGHSCQTIEECKNVDCSAYDSPVKSGYRPDCVNNECRCMCYGCE